MTKNPSSFEVFIYKINKFLKTHNTHQTPTIKSLQQSLVQ